MSVGDQWRDYFARDESTYFVASPSRRFLFRLPHEPLVVRLLEMARIPLGGTVLEAGVGSGKFSVAFAARGYRVTALDVVPQALHNTMSLANEYERCVGAGLSIATVCGDLEASPVASDTYDLVFNEGVVEHWLKADRRRAILAIMAAAAKERGYVGVIVPNGFHPFWDRWIQTGYPGYTATPPFVRYGPAELRADLEASGISQVEVDGLATWGSLNLWPRRPLRARALYILERLAKPPRRVRMTWGTHLIAVGRKLNAIPTG